MVPGPAALLAEKRDEAETKLGLISSLPKRNPPNSDDLYVWADDIFTQLKARGEQNPKLALAEALGIPDDLRWKGIVAPLHSLPRHRIVARFARERLWKRVWSLNWDYNLECAFCSVGIKDGSVALDEGLPWPTIFYTHITAAEASVAANDSFVHLIKPHGCVMALIRSRNAMSTNLATANHLANRFLITQSELAAQLIDDGTNKYFYFSFCVECNTHPLVLLGWSVAEQYLRKRFLNDVKPVLDDRAPLGVDELSIIDPVFRPGHKDIVACYGKTEAESHIAVATAPPDLTTDKLFLWIQSLYAIDCLSPWAEPAEKPVLEAIAKRLEQPPDDFPHLLNWADEFLPAWTRLCWHFDLIRCRDQHNNLVRGDKLVSDKRDEHIPWCREIATDRPDMKAAAQMLVVLERSGHAMNWDFKPFPGALFRQADNVAAVPMPGWDGDSNVLRGLKTLDNALNAPGSAAISEVWLIPIHWDPSQVVQVKKVQELRQFLSQAFNTVRFTAGKIRVKQLTDL